MTSLILLDQNNNSIPPTGYLVIDSEVAFLECAMSGQALFIRGNHLCAWAKEFFDGRRIDYREAPSPVDDLIQTYPTLTLEQAKFICDDLSENLSKMENFSASEIINTIFVTHLWTSIPSKKHAAEWLLWLDETNPDDAYQPMLAIITNEWGQLAPDLSEIYDVRTPVAAREILGKWLGAKITPFIEKFGEFPIPITEQWLNLLDKSWSKEIVRANGTFISEFILMQVPWHFKQHVAIASLDYFEKFPESETFTLERYNQIARFVSGEDRIRLSTIKPAKVPTDLPESAESVLNWFTKEYLPFRQWQISTQAKDAYQRVLELGLQFAEWYLDFYPQAINSKKYLSFFKSKELKDQSPKYVDLLVILDGLHVLDAKVVINTLLKEVSVQKLTLTENTLCYGPIPTVTDFAKGALVRGVQPTLMKEIELLGEDISDRHTPLPLLQSAVPGDLFIWRIQEPDSTYHTKNASPMLKSEIEGELNTIAQKLIDIANKVNPAIPLRIIITTDHGRFLGISRRDIGIPEGMQAHGRAAWGKTNIQFDKKGYKIDGDLVYLSKDRFGLLDDDAAVILTDSAFQHEKYVQEFSTHGGLFPEEVIIPWIVIERNMARPDLEFTLSGEGRTNHPGTIHVTVLNPSSIELTLVKSEILFGDNKIVVEFEKEIPVLKMTEFEIEIASWPSSEQILRGQALAIIRMPSGDEFKVPWSITTLQVTELYKRDKSFLEGLEL